MQEGATGEMQVPWVLVVRVASANLQQGQGQGRAVPSGTLCDRFVQSR